MPLERVTTGPLEKPSRPDVSRHRCRNPRLHGPAGHLAFPESPFRQALEAIHRRMHALGIEH
jgi:hypothetical protein